CSRSGRDYGLDYW
nr:immunoglobulin heavy chain junction region [Mus musculus]